MRLLPDPARGPVSPYCGECARRHPADRPCYAHLKAAEAYLRALASTTRAGRAVAREVRGGLDDLHPPSDEPVRRRRWTRPAIGAVLVPGAWAVYAVAQRLGWVG
jgi:hypothetical protein